MGNLPHYLIAAFAFALCSTVYADETPAPKKPVFDRAGVSLVVGDQRGIVVGREAWRSDAESEITVGATGDGLVWRVRRGGTIAPLGKEKELDIGVKSDFIGRFNQPLRLEVGMRKQRPDGGAMSRLYAIGGMHGDEKLDIRPWGAGVGGEVRGMIDPQKLLELQMIVELFMTGGAKSSKKDMDVDSGATARVKGAMTAKTPLKIGQYPVSIKAEAVYNAADYIGNRKTTGVERKMRERSLTGLLSAGVAF